MFVPLAWDLDEDGNGSPRRNFFLLLLMKPMFRLNFIYIYIKTFVLNYFSMYLHLQHFSNSYFVNICKAKDKLVQIDQKKKRSRFCVSQKLK